MGIDVGTTFSKAAVVTLDGNEVAHGQRPTPWTTVPTGAEIDPRALAETATAAALDALAAAPDGRVRGIGICSMGETGVMLDEAGDPIPCAEVTTVEISTGPGMDQVDLGAVLGSDFASLTSLTAQGGAGRDFLYGGPFGATLDGGAGRDELAAGSGVDALLGGGESDIFRVSSASDTGTTIEGGEGRDTVVLFADAGIVVSDGGSMGTAFVDRIKRVTVRPSSATSAVDLSGFSGDSVVGGTPFPISVLGGTGADLVRGGGGRDVLRGRGGNDILLGGKGKDLLIGGPGHNRIDGGRGVDACSGDAHPVNCEI